MLLRADDKCDRGGERGYEMPCGDLCAAHAPPCQASTGLHTSLLHGRTCIPALQTIDFECFSTGSKINESTQLCTDGARLIRNHAPALTSAGPAGFHRAGQVDMKSRAGRQRGTGRHDSVISLAPVLPSTLGTAVVPWWCPAQSLGTSSSFLHLLSVVQFFWCVFYLHAMQTLR